MKYVSIIMAILALGLIIGCSSSSSSDDGGGGGGGGTTGDMLDLINTGRNNVGQASLTRDTTIDAVAQAYANLYETEQPNPCAYYSDVDGLTPQQRLTNGGVTYSNAAETGYGDYNVSITLNIAYNGMTSSILNSATYSKVGIGVHSYYCTS